MTGRTATLIGATGLIGSQLLEQLQQDDHFDLVRLLVRRPFAPPHPKVQVKLVNFADHESFKLGIDGSDAVFSAVGTTQAKVKGDRAAYRRVDYDIPVRAARFCQETGCPHFSIVSSVGAKEGSRNFYLDLKGEVDEAVSASGVGSVAIFRPSMLLGHRRERRPAEKLGQAVMKTLSFALVGGLRKFRAVEASQVAAAMLKAAKEARPGVSVYEYEDIIRFSRAQQDGHG